MPAADNIRSCREPSFLKTEASLNEIIWNQRGGNCLQGRKGAAMSSTAAVHQHALRPRRTSAPTRDESQAPSPIPSGTASPKAPRRHSRRSSTRQDNRTNTRHRPSTQPKPKRRSQPKSAPVAQPPQQHPAGYTHTRETKARRPAQSQAAQPTLTRTGGEAAEAAAGRIAAHTRD